MLLRADDVPLDLIGQVGRSVVEVVGEKRSTWRRWNLMAEAARQTMGWRFATVEDREAITAMVADAAERSDLTIITDDNPRSEDPAQIRAAVVAGAREAGGEVLEVAGRREAIRAALRGAGPDTVIAILGKGHERTQTLADHLIEFDDVLEAERAWAEGMRDAQ